MKWPEIDPATALRQLRSGRPALDVRSPGEFNEGSIPGYVNIAILNDEHRHEVGWTYKNKGREEAIQVGHRLVDPIKPELLTSWAALLKEPGLVTCWRGGLRSLTAAQWLEEKGVEGHRVAGGYKAQRHSLLSTFDHQREWLVLGGLTGSGKTELLVSLPSESVLDLEGLARHRGSAFGGLVGVQQPPQQTFENGIGLKLFERAGPFVVENESSLIGTCSVPRPLRGAIAQAPLVRIRSTFEERIQRIFREYVLEPKVNREDLLNLHLMSLQKISRALGGLRAAKMQELLKAAFSKPELQLEDHQPWIETLLKEYYDPMYEFSVKKEARTVVFEGSYDDVRNHIAHTLDRRRA